MGDKNPSSELVEEKTTNVSPTSCASEKRPADKLLVESQLDSNGEKIKVWPTPLSEDETYSLFSENKLLLDQE